MGDIRVRWYAVYLCDLCVNGAGGECHVPGCALWIRRAPELALWDWQCRPLAEENVPPPPADEVSTPPVPGVSEGDGG